MKWTLVDSCGLGIVSKPPATGRVFSAFNKLPHGSHGFSQPLNSQSAHHPPITRITPAGNAAVFITSEDQ